MPLNDEPVGAADAAANCIAAKLPTAVAPPVSANSRATCVPAGSVAVTLIVRQACQPPLSGIVIGPVTFAPFSSRWNRPPCPEDATTKLIVFAADETLTVYFSHSPASTQPTSNPPADEGSISTSPVRNAPPLLPDVES